MPYYLFNTPQGRLAVFAQTDDEAIKLLFQKAGMTFGDPSIRGEGSSDTPPGGYSIITSATNANQLSGGTGNASNEGVSLAPIGGTTGSGLQTGQTFKPEDPGTLGRTGAFRRALTARGIDTGTLAGGAQLGRQEEFENLFNLLQLTGQVPEGERSFEQFASQTASPFTGALDFLRNVATKQAGGNLTDPLREFANPTDDQGINRAAGAFTQALQGRVGSIADNPWFRALTGRLASEFGSQSQQQQQAQPFFNFARNRIGLF